MEAEKKVVRKGKALLIKRQQKELSTSELQNLAMCAVNSTTHRNEDFAEAAEVLAKPISTGPGGSG
jgi:hypothetical protein